MASRLLLGLTAGAVAIAGALTVTGVGSTAAAADRMTWGPVNVHGGGWVTGMVTTSSGDVYSRTDVGGAYRWNESTREWKQLITASGIPNPHGSDYGVESLNAAPGNSKVVYAAVGENLGGTDGRIVRSADGGNTWRTGSQRFSIAGNAENRWGGERLSVDPENPDVVMFGSRKQGLWRSEDGGTTWVRTSAPAGTAPHDPAGVNFTLFDPASPVVGGKTQGAWAGVQNVGILRTDDAGRSWRTVHAVPNGIPRHASRAFNGNLFVAVTGSPSQVVRVSPSGSPTVLSLPNGSYASVAVDPQNSSRVFVGDEGVRDGKMWRSLDGGSSWSTLDVAVRGDAEDGWVLRADIDKWMSNGAFVFDPARPGTLWFAEGMGVWRTTDLADTEVTWDFVSDGIEELVSNAAVKPRGKPLITASWDRGLFRHPTPERGGAELPHMTGFGSAWDVTQSPTDNNFLTAVLDDHQDLSGKWHPQRRASGYSTDGGATWTRFAALAAGTAPADLLLGNIASSAGNNDNLVWIPSLDWSGGKAYYSTNRGASWTAGTLNGAVDGDYFHPAHYLKRDILVADPLTAGTFYAIGGNHKTGNGYLWKTTNGGAAWNKVSNVGRDGYWDFRFNSKLVALPGRSGYLYAIPGQTDGATTPFWRSADGGRTWVQKNDILDAHDIGVGAPMTTGGNPALYTFGRVGGVLGFFSSTDLGDSWTRLGGHPRDWHQGVTDIVGDPEVPGKVYAGFPGGGYAMGQVGGAPTATTVPLPTSPVTTAPSTTAPPTTAPATAPATTAAPSTGPDLGVLQDARARLANRRSGLLMQVRSGSRASGARVVQYSDTGGTHQRWNRSAVPGEPWYSYLRNVRSGMCLEGVPMTGGFMAVQRPCNGSQAQRWWVRDNGTALAFHHKTSWQVLEASGTRPGGLIVMRSYTGAPSQFFAVGS